MASFYDKGYSNISETMEEYGYDSYEDYYSDVWEGYAVCRYGRQSAVFLPVLYSLCFVIGVIGNGLVFWVIVARLKLKSMTDVCLLNLAIADLLLLCNLPFLAHYARADWVFGDAMCKVVMGTYYIGLYSGIFFVTLMSIDRYLAIVRAVYALRDRKRIYGVIGSAIIWILGVLASFPEILFIAVHSHSGTTLCLAHYDKEHNSLRVFGLLKMNVLCLLIPLIIIVFCYSMIIWRLMNSKSTNKTIQIVLLVVVVFFCCWVPYNIASFFKALELLHIYASCDSSKAIQLSLQITEALAYSHTCWNPILYVFVEQKFRKHFLGLINGTLCIKHPFFTISPTLNLQTSKTDQFDITVL